MKNTIKCPYCHKEFEPNEALTHQIEEKVLASLEAKHKTDLEEVKRKAEKMVSARVGKDLESEKQRNKKLSGQVDELIDEVRKRLKKIAPRAPQLTNNNE